MILFITDANSGLRLDIEHKIMGTTRNTSLLRRLLLKWDSVVLSDADMLAGRQYLATFTWRETWRVAQRVARRQEGDLLEDEARSVVNLWLILRFL